MDARMMPPEPDPIPVPPASAVATSSASPDDIEALIGRVKERGFVTTGEIFAALPDLEPETAELAAIYASMESNGVQVVDEILEELTREDERRHGRGEPPSSTVTDAVDAAVERSRGPATRPGAAASPDLPPGAGQAAARPLQPGTIGRMTCEGWCASWKTVWVATHQSAGPASTITKVGADS